MAQIETNRDEWNNPQNWTGGWFSLYRSDRDSRLWVPKRNPALGFTLNFARRGAVASFLIMLSAGLAVAALVGYVAATR
jgi:uncharacterized membrane protein